MQIQELLDMVDAVEYIGQYVDLEEKNGEYWGLSPFQAEKTPSFSVRRETGRWYCFSTGRGGNLISFIAQYNHVSNGEAVRILKKYAKIEDSDSDLMHKTEKLASVNVFAKYRQKKYAEKAVSTSVLPDNYMERFEDAPDKLQLWRDEGISDEAMRFFGVKYDSFSNCIVYPVRNDVGKIVNIGGRTLDPNFKVKNIRKYTYFKPWNGAMSVVYGLFENKDEILAKHEIIIFEGVKSVMLARSYGIKNTGAILTSHLNPHQMKILARLGVPVTFALDADVDVKKDRHANILKKYTNVRYLYDFRRLLGEKDAPVDKGEAVFRELYERCKYKL